VLPQHVHAGEDQCGSEEFGDHRATSRKFTTHTQASLIIAVLPSVARVAKPPDVERPAVVVVVSCEPGFGATALTMLRFSHVASTHREVEVVPCLALRRPWAPPRRASFSVPELLRLPTARASHVLRVRGPLTILVARPNVALVVTRLAL
jgi:hypothetical protein